MLNGHSLKLLRSILEHQPFHSTLQLSTISIENSVILCVNAVGMIPSGIQSLCLLVTILTLGAGLTQLRGLEHQFLHCLMLDMTFWMMLRKLMFVISTFVQFLQKKIYLTLMTLNQKSHQLLLLIYFQFHLTMLLFN